MKKIFLAMAALACSMSISAQVIKVCKGTEVVATYTASQADNVIFEEVPKINVTSITLNRTSVTLYKGSTMTLAATVLPSNADDKTVGWSSSNEAVALVSSTGTVAAIAVGTATITVTANDGSGVSATCTVTVSDQSSDTHAYVEIGGLKWATMNVGATTVAGSPSTCYGDYYAWGETEPRYTSITISGENSVSFGGWNSSHSRGYSYSDYPSYTGTTLDADHDAATKNWGSGWRTPTHEDYVKLYEACGGTGSYISITLPIGTTSTTAKGIYWCNDYDGVKGLLFSDGTNKVFFPAAGYCLDTSFNGGGSLGVYWSSSLRTSGTNGAYCLLFDSSDVYPSLSDSRYFGFPVRPVSE